MIRYTRIDSPLGVLLVARDETGLTELWMPSGKHRQDPAPGWIEDDTAFDDVSTQLGEYFAGTRTDFDLPLHPTGTAFQLKAWAALREIPYGETRSYGAQAENIGRPTAARAVGLANGQNPISIIVPCHRVVGANGSLTGYGGGLDAKRWLLSHEADHARLGLFA
ncbi:MAG TPA: methylated-DNA--[protein]-cysteine S-methyltransferase [Jatrophihabitans sp.]|jgi:methylated-DNA-[protein]-cysteine S-methyltransferase|uniref:methylated-DNA--[protein]-cysteine S-methyltransferase n=1 Tax=Jatrophihabitans sp. TaxID=1932789 RepID=UPI002E0815B0|nr:methylated-DNA--[protein]-cysteine S-methyltransferase [Jatrophihabitans sp.]